MTKKKDRTFEITMIFVVAGINTALAAMTFNLTAFWGWACLTLILWAFSEELGCET